MPQIMTTKELAAYLKLHPITICKYAEKGVIPAKRIGRVWRFDKEAIDAWVGGDQSKVKGGEISRTKRAKKTPGKKKTRLRKG